MSDQDILKQFMVQMLCKTPEVYSGLVEATSVEEAEEKIKEAMKKESDIEYEILGIQELPPQTEADITEPQDNVVQFPHEAPKTLN